MSYAFSKTSLERMEGVHPLLIKTAKTALSYNIMDLTIPPYGGMRTVADQNELIERGASKTMNSLHLPQGDGYAHALDIIPYPVDWHDENRFLMMATLMFRASVEHGIVIEWGGHWKSFKDLPHFQLNGFIQ